MGEKNFVCLSLIFLTAAVALFAGHAQAADICAKANYVALCRSTVKGVTDPVAATKLAIEQLMFETKRGKEELVKMGRSPPLNTCTQNYGDNVIDLQECLQLLKSKDKITLMVRLSAVLSMYSVCDDAIGEGGVVTLAASVVSMDRMLMNLASNCLHLAGLT